MCGCNSHSSRRIVCGSVGRGAVIRAPCASTATKHAIPAREASLPRRQASNDLYLTHDAPSAAEADQAGGVTLLRARVDR